MIRKEKFLLIAGYADSLINFRGPLIKEILRRGVEVHVAAPAILSNSLVKSKLVTLGVNVHDIHLWRTGMNPLADFCSLFDMYRLMREISPLHVLAYTSKPIIYGTPAAWLLGIPNRYALVTGLGYAFTAPGQRGVLRRLVQVLYARALVRTSLVFFQNPDDELLFRQLGLLAPSVRSCILNGSGVDLSTFVVAPIPTGGPHFLLIARLLGDKGVREYVAAACLVKAQYPQFKFSLVGWIDSNPDAIPQSELDQWIHDGVIDYLGRMEDVRPAIAACSVYVLPSYREGTPRTVLEAMAMGRPIITTDAPGCRETVIDGENGFLVPVRSVDALVAAMERFIKDPDLSLRMGKRSREIAEEKYDVHKVNAVMIREMGL
ncbi:MAG: glycosyltransferase family 4 protein [Fluviibacter phosphoraccumulans]